MLHFSLFKKIYIWAVCLFGLLYALPTFVPAMQSDDDTFLPSKAINLGLDLQGGSHILLQVETDVVLKEQMQAMLESISYTLRRNNAPFRNLTTDENGISLTLRNVEQMNEVKKLLRKENPDFIITSEDPKIFLEMSEEGALKRRQSAINQSIEIIRRRVDETGTKEPTIQQQGDNRILVQLPGVEDPERVKELLGKTAKLTFHIVDVSADVNAALQGRVKPGTILLPSVEEDDKGEPLRYYVVSKRVEVGGETLVDSQPSFQDNQPVVSFRFNTAGGRKFGRATQRSVGKPLAIVLDGAVISSPRVNEPILGGSGVITGNFSVQEASDLALLLRAGALPAPLVVLEERTVGPGLGRDSVESGKNASIIGLILVAIYMVVSYGRFGVISIVGLTANILLIVALLAVLGATLTLPGIAGIVLTVGMAVDANVLIFERIRFECNSGRPIFKAIESGYKRAMVTIVDANLTTLIAALVLYAFGTGPIKGFAVTLTVGIVTSMFTAIMVTRMLVAGWYLKNRPQKLPI